ncbi:rhomboid family intramembrane serine protease [Lactobacillus pasteurii]|uniref:Putative membrane protein n=1 Tax=Lactobacillus pasteurii DSM 23907 = CRBIP 24.76 TaxID=1423790 RepID=I7LEH1_9LACO|nr:rhomboid family intramembrane serine protease [Lactobacillus pasteurii]TDG75548.1 hypothetical protein C5L33_000433 [Lactobacillus pasteurii]CCI85773.1 Putative membrane protein [Lactobacillus pasteurii DSM 23907 = CRBIP 24.76]
MNNRGKLDLSSCYMTVFILVVLLGFYLAETFMGGSENPATLMKLGAMNNYAVAAGHQWWRLFTAQFLHIGIMHLVSNAVMIFYLGNYFESIIGHWRFWVIYLLSGVGGNLMSFAFGSDNSLSAGASTALFGLLGAVIAISRRRASASPNSSLSAMLNYFGRQAAALAIINLAIDIFMPNVDIQGHIGGLLMGFMATAVLGDRLPIKQNTKFRIIMAALMIVYVVFTFRKGMFISMTGLSW